jgi:hypothetical protein
MDSAKTYRRYAQECRRLAERALAKDKAVLFEIAEAWEQCAREAERKEPKTRGKDSSDLNAIG